MYSKDSGRPMRRAEVASAARRNLRQITHVRSWAWPHFQTSGRLQRPAFTGLFVTEQSKPCSVQASLPDVEGAHPAARKNRK
jgi:hypothetical protein